MVKLAEVTFYNKKKDIFMVNNFDDFKNNCFESFNINKDEINNYKFIISYQNVPIEIENDSMYKEYILDENIAKISIQYNFQNELNKVNDLLNNIKKRLNNIEDKTKDYKKICENSKKEFDEFANHINSKIIILTDKKYWAEKNAKNSYVFNNNMNNNQTNAFQINICFINTMGNKIFIQTYPEEYMSSVINKYINKSNDLNMNYYLYNGKRIVQSLTVAELGIFDGSEIHVANAGNIIGAFI